MLEDSLNFCLCIWIEHLISKHNFSLDFIKPLQIILLENNSFKPILDLHEVKVHPLLVRAQRLLRGKQQVVLTDQVQAGAEHIGLRVKHVLLQTCDYHSRQIRVVVQTALAEFLEYPLVGLLALDVREASCEHDGASEVVDAGHVYLEQSVFVLPFLGHGDEHDFPVESIGLKHVLRLEEDDHRGARIQCDLGLWVFIFHLVEVGHQQGHVQLYVAFDQLECVEHIDGYS